MYQNLGAYINIIIMLAAGVFGLLLAFKKIDLSRGKPENKDKWEKWHKDLGKAIKIVSILIIIVGIFNLVVQILGV